MLVERLVDYAEHEAAHAEQTDLLRIADAIERELAERYVLLPLDADGVPIHVGDELMGYGYPTGGAYCKAIIGSWGILAGGQDSNYQRWLLWSAEEVRHHHKPTLEDVLRELLQRYDTLRLGPEAFDPFELVDEYADKVREVVE